jgi:FkbM family methyltransferase
MQEHLLKRALRATVFRPGAVRRIRLGPLRGMRFRVGPATGLAPWYSGGERAQQQVMADIVRPGDCAIDVGANWGVHTLHLAQLVGPSGRVLAFEPYPPAFDELRWHVETNACHNVDVFPCALADVVGTGAFQPGANAWMGQLLDHDAPGTISVGVDTLDAVADRMHIGRVTFIKIDAEGGEGRILLGAAQLVERTRPVVLIEPHTPDQDGAVARFFTARDYVLERLGGPPITNLDRTWPDPTGVWGVLLAKPR